jgi:CubicO group peptidase (beta-lactamase class C family)
MLNMVSGISDNDPAIYGDHLTQPITREAMFANLNNQPLMWAPGTHMVYTNANYNLLGLVVEPVSGQPCLTFLREHLFSRLGMSSTSTLDRLILLLDAELRHIAHRYMRLERDGHTLQTTALINEAYLRLVNEREIRSEHRAQFLALAAQVMRHILVDHARGVCRGKRGNGIRDVPLDEAFIFSHQKSNDPEPSLRTSIITSVQERI